MTKRYFYPFAILLVLSAIAPDLGTAFTNITTDVSALLALKSQLSLEPSHDLSMSWSDSTSICNWIRVTCGSRHQRVTGLDLSYMNLSTNLPPQIGNLSFLVSLNLSSNNLFGNIPQELGRLKRLRILDFSFNNLGGDIPTNLSTCSRLQILYLSSNRFSGSIPRGIWNLRRLESLYLDANYFTGNIPDELSNITTLRRVNLENNRLSGSISAKTFNMSRLQFINCRRNKLSGILPVDMFSHLKQLQEVNLQENSLYGPFPTRLNECTSLRVVQLSQNNFTGVLPREIGNSSLLEELYLAENMMTGAIPQEIGNLMNLRQLELSRNIFSGNIPASIFNISTLRKLDLSTNRLVGNLPLDLGLGLPNLEQIDIIFNNLTSSSSTELSFLTSLTNCRNITHIAIGRNPLNGALPSSIGNFSTTLESLSMYACGLVGDIPQEIGNLTNLILLDVLSNNLTGTLLTTLSNLRHLQGLRLEDNRITGTIPNSLCDMRTPFYFFLSDNELNGSIPECIGSITTLRVLDFNNNNLESIIPASLWQLRDLTYLDLSLNSLSGSLSVELGNLRSLDEFALFGNQLSGPIPDTIGNLRGLTVLLFSRNRFQGSIPETIGEMESLEIIGLSQNNLSGGIPVLMENLVYLRYLNLSFNGLSGEIPTGGPFVNFTSQSFMFNQGLCGDPRYNVTLCPEPNVAKAKGKWKLRVVFITLGALILFIVILSLACKVASARKKRRAPKGSKDWEGPTQMRISYYELLDATDKYSESNLIGSGSFGSVYRGTLRNGDVVAVKVFHQQREGAFESFEVECEALRKLRHRNLCKVICCCSNEEFKALILEYMPNGSLEMLYSTSSSLDLVQRISIMVDVASALEYLHCGYSTPMVHCDLKPSNILLDEDMVGHLCDFGLAKLLGDGETATHTMTLATLGYIAPEFGTDGRVSVKGDVYSYGITLMEVFTRMKPNDDFFMGDLSLKSWVEDSMAGDIDHIVDPSIIHGDAEEEERSILKLNSIRSIMELALRCLCESPRDRINMKDVNASLKKIRDQLL